MGDTCLPSFFVINTTINQLHAKVSLKTIYCLRLFIVVYKYIPCITVISTKINQLQSRVSLITTYCLGLFAVYKHVMLHAQGQM